MDYNPDQLRFRHSIRSGPFGPRWCPRTWWRMATSGDGTRRQARCATWWEFAEPRHPLLLPVAAIHFGGTTEAPEPNRTFATATHCWASANA